jgi:hypothetical protein
MIKCEIMRCRFGLATIFAIGITVTLGLGIAEAAKSKSFTSSFSGTAVSVPLDIDNDSCTGPPFVCTDFSTLNNYSGKVTGGGKFAGPFTGQTVVELLPVAGSGCSLNPTGQKSCTLGTAKDACEYTFVAGSFVNQKSATGDLVYGAVTSLGSSECVDYNSAGGFALPYPFSATVNGTLTGGTGKLTGSTGTYTNTTTGQILSIDLQGHVFGWTTTTSMVTTP